MNRTWRTFASFCISVTAMTALVSIGCSTSPDPQRPNAVSDDGDDDDDESRTKPKRTKDAGRSSDAKEVLDAAGPRDAALEGTTGDDANTSVTCHSGRADCNQDASDGCEVTLASNLANCGQCGHACKSGEVCAAGSCTSTCPSTLTTCGQSCVDTKVDPDHCGGCGKGCAAPVHGVATCKGAKCDFACESGYRRCGAVCIADSVASCGASCTPCGAPANATPACNGGVCSHTCNPGYVACSSGCCTPEASCTLRTFYQDLDGDGYGSTVTTKECYQPPGFVGISGDCDDGNPTVHPNQTAGSDQPFTVTGTSRKSYDYDCNGAEESTVGAISPCNTNSTGWANGEVCSTSYHLGNRCSSGSVYDGGIVMTCGSNYFECKYAAGTIQPTWTVKGKIPCR